MGDSLQITVRWSGTDYDITIPSSDSVASLKGTIFKQTGVRPERQKLLNLKHQGKVPENDCLLSELKLKPGFKIMMMGSLEEDIADASSVPEDLPEVVDDFDIPEGEEIALENREVHLAKIERRVKEHQINILNPPREGKKLLVLDIDYTLFDHRSPAESGVELMRPYLHEFLTSAYRDYDIVIWSATSMKWIEEKMKLLGVSKHVDYKICFYLDCSAMITVHAPKYGVVQVKPLGVIWGKFPEYYKPSNTIMFDDINRNFLMNPKNGLKIRPFQKAHINRHKDVELIKLAKYLRLISKQDDLTNFNHKHWEKYLSKLKEKKRKKKLLSNSSDDHDPSNNEAGASAGDAS
nr:PREDICTED: ubiquitin-like domain-containing CTD phosphatase 1 [Bemisia tabaci]